MSEALRTIFLVMLFVGIMTIQMNMDADKTTARQLKNILELATHDAALALDESQLSEGRIVFDQVQAKEYLKESITHNMKVDNVLGDQEIYQPADDSYYHDSLYITDMIFLDDLNISSFPYHYTNASYGIDTIINGPTIFVVGSIQSPRYFAGNGVLIEKTVMYEYFQY
ncbi:peptidase M23 [Gracilibacillus sp. YIM 98692]|uniref:peptidase M23 n=1 Tax=Gracilibacillus sp. YIM 98692 TaxID=2663532 RepID=UPI0013D82615|nr:peptidase M23 [Gracilibacillus sp. YIM 98692]